MESYAFEHLNRHKKGLFRKRQSIQSMLSWSRVSAKTIRKLVRFSSVSKFISEMMKCFLCRIETSEGIFVIVTLIRTVESR